MQWKALLCKTASAQFSMADFIQGNDMCGACCCCAMLLQQREGIGALWLAEVLLKVTVDLYKLCLPELKSPAMRRHLWSLSKSVGVSWWLCCSVAFCAENVSQHFIQASFYVYSCHAEHTATCIRSVSLSDVLCTLAWSKVFFKEPVNKLSAKCG